MSCLELERLFVAGSSEARAHEHAQSCPTCAVAERDERSVHRLVSELKSPTAGPDLQQALLAIPARTVDCEAAGLLIAQAIDDEIAPSDNRRLTFHLSRCRACSETSETLRGVRELVAPQPAPWFAGRIAASVSSRPRQAPRGALRWLLNPRAAIALAYAAALVLMLTGFNPADLARKARTELPLEAKSVAGAASSTLADRVGAFGERALRTGMVLKSRVFGYGRAALSNAVQLVLKSEPAPIRSRPSSGQERSAPSKNETAVATWRA